MANFNWPWTFDRQTLPRAHVLRFGRNIALLLACSCVGLRANTLIVGIEDLPGTRWGEGAGDFNDVVVAITGNVVVIGGRGNPLTQAVLDQNGHPYWDNRTLDGGSNGNIGQCLLLGGCPLQGSPYTGLEYYDGFGPGNGDLLFSADGLVTFTVLEHTGSLDWLTALSWYDPSNPVAPHEVVSGGMKSGSVTGGTTSVFGLKLHSIVDYYSQVGLGGNAQWGDVAQQHFAVFGEDSEGPRIPKLRSTPVPEPGACWLIAIGMVGLGLWGSPLRVHAPNRL